MWGFEGHKSSWGSVSFSSGASLGAVVVDAVGSASAGSLVALLGAYAQLQGLDPLDFLQRGGSIESTST